MGVGRPGVVIPVYSVPPRCVLAVTDLSEPAGEAVGRAARLAARYGARLLVLYVAPPHVAPELVEFARLRLRSHLRRHAREVPAARGTVRTGRVAAVVPDEAGGEGADLLVLGARGRHRPGGTGLGGVAGSLVRTGEVPALVVRRPPGGAYRKVLLAVDESTASLAAARTGTGLTPEAERLLVHCVTVPGEHLLRMRGVPEGELERLRRTRTEQARPAAERIAADLAPRPARVLVAPGRPQDAVPRLAGSEGADLAVVGTGTRSAVGYAVLGSVAQHVVSEAPCDVLVVPGPGPGPGR
ncbi:universal stress protein [Streptomyces fenghuangensis]